MQLRNGNAFLLAAVVISVVVAECAGAKDVRSELKVHVGDKAPDFVLTTGEGKKVKLSDFMGRIILLDLYRAHW